MTSFAIKPFVRSLSGAATQPRVRPSLATFRPSVVDPYRAAAAREQGLAAAIAGSWPLKTGPYRTGI
jgi:hypothetical protein